MNRILPISLLILLTLAINSTPGVAQPPGRPGQPLTKASIADLKRQLADMNDDQLQRFLRRTRREVRNRALLGRLGQRYSRSLLEEVSATYDLAPPPEFREIGPDETLALRRLLHNAELMAVSRGIFEGAADMRILSGTVPETPGANKRYVASTETDVYQAATGVVAIIDRDAFDTNLKLTTTPLNNEDSEVYLCDFVSFRDLHTTLVRGSGFLINIPTAANPGATNITGVAGEVIVTARHVMDSIESLDDVYFVFGYEVIEGSETRLEYTAADVYEGEQVFLPTNSHWDRDFAIITLDGTPSSKGHTPLPYRETGIIADAALVYMIGHPLGMPMLYSDPKQITSNSDCLSFETDLIAYDYHSGSPVINSDHVVEGVMLRGPGHFERYCECQAPANTTSTRRATTSRAVRMTTVADFLKHGDEILVHNISDVPAVVTTTDDYIIESGASAVVAWAPDMFLQAESSESDVLDLPGCTQQYQPEQGETWTILQGPTAGGLTMSACYLESGTEGR